MIDCFTQKQIHTFFRKCLRVLKPGGALRMAALDLAPEVQIAPKGHDTKN